MVKAIIAALSLFILNVHLSCADSITVSAHISGDTLGNRSADSSNLTHLFPVIESNRLSVADRGNQQIPDRDFQIDKPRPQNSRVFIAIVLLLSLLLITFVRAGYPKEFKELFSVIKSLSLTQQIYRAQTTSLSIPLIILSLNAVLSFSLTLFFTAHYFNIHLNYSDFNLFLILTAGIAILFIYRIGSASLAGNLFPVKKEMGFYTYTTLQLLRICGIILLPVNVLLAYGDAGWNETVLTLGVMIFTGVALFAYFRGFTITKDLFQRNKFHFLLYICTLEITPALVIIKFLMSWVKKN